MENLSEVLDKIFLSGWKSLVNRMMDYLQVTKLLFFLAWGWLGLKDPSSSGLIVEEQCKTA